jgi:small subunit ribosomal protein S14
MKNLIERDQKRRNLVRKIEKKRRSLKQLVYNRKEIDLENRWSANTKLGKLKRDSSKSRVRNRCLYTGRSRGVLKQFRMARHFFRDKSKNGFLPGFIKASW